MYAAKFRVWTISIVFLAAAPPLRAELNRWHPIGPPTGRVDTIAVDALNPALVYSASRTAGLFRTENGGSSWLFVSISVMEPEITTVLTDRNISGRAYVGTRLHGLFISDDAGLTWSAASTLPLKSVNAIDQGLDGSLYIGGPEALYRSLDRGTTWQQITFPALGGASVAAVKTDAFDLRVIFAALNRHTDPLYKSSDGGVTWEPAFNGLFDRFVIELAADNRQPGLWYAGTSGGFYRSSDYGSTWEFSNDGLWPNRVLAVLPDSAVAGVVMMSDVSGGVYRSSNGGRTWIPVAGITTVIPDLAVTPTKPNILYAAGEPPLKSEDGGRTWLPVQSGIIASQPTSIAVPADTRSAILSTFPAMQPNPGMYRSEDEGQTWRFVSSLAPGFPFPEWVKVHAYDPRVAVIAGPAMILYSEDAGRSGSQRSPFTGISFRNAEVEVDAFDVSTLYRIVISDSLAGPSMPLSYSLSRSHDTGLSWQPVGTGLPTNGISNLTSDLFSIDTLYVKGVIDLGAGAFTTGVFKSVDAGATWFPVNTGLPLAAFSTQVQRIYPDRGRRGRLYAIIGSEGSAANGMPLVSPLRIYATENGGASWEYLSDIPRPLQLGDRLQVLTGFVTHSHLPGLVYVSILGGGVFLSQDSGRSWQAFNEGLWSLKVIGLAIDPLNSSRLYAATQWNGLFAITFSPRFNRRRP